jgi:hypothetical protein
MKFFNNCEKTKILLMTHVILEVKQTRTLRTVLICVVVIAIFSYTIAAVRPLVQQDESLVSLEKISLCKSMKSPHKDKPDVVGLGDPIEDPIPHKI